MDNIIISIDFSMDDGYIRLVQYLFQTKCAAQSSPSSSLSKPVLGLGDWESA